MSTNDPSVKKLPQGCTLVHLGNAPVDSGELIVIDPSYSDQKNGCHESRGRRRRRVSRLPSVRKRIRARPLHRFPMVAARQGRRWHGYAGER
jgi:hypothetical protein